MNWERDLKVFQMLGSGKWALAAYGFIVETGSRAEMEAAYERWMEASDD